MSIYILLYFFLLAGIFLKRNKQRFHLIFSFFLLFFLAAFRDTSVGTDTSTYEEIFNRVSVGGQIVQETGWFYFNKIVVYFGGDFRWLLVFSSLLVIFPIYRISKRYSFNPCLSIFLFYTLYFYLQSFNIMRQIIAVSVLLLFIPFLFKKKYIHFVVGVALASLFHTTALLAVPFVFINRLKISRKLMCVFVFISLVFGVSFSSLVIDKIADLLGYVHYLEVHDENSETGLFMIITNIFAMFFIITSSKDSHLLKLFFLYILLYNLTVGVPYAYRLTFVFSIVQILFLPYYIKNNILGLRPEVKWLVICYATLNFIRSFGSGEIIPYIQVVF